jgi:hypothetical protein
MNKQTMTILLVVLPLMGAASAFLMTQQSRQKLGQPGVKVVAEPTWRVEEIETNGTVLVISSNIISSNSVFLPPRVLDYTSEIVPVPHIVWTTLPKDTSFAHRFYKRRDGTYVDCQVVLMGADRTSIHQPQYCLQGMGFRIVSEGKAVVPIERPHAYSLPITKLKVVSDRQTESGQVQRIGGVFVYWFVADGQLTADHGERMWWIARDLLRTGVLQRWSYVICFAPCPLGSEEKTYEQIKEFIAAAVPEFHTAGSGDVTSVSRR